MIYFARYGLSILLMLLQLAAPLIHAHKNVNNFDGMLHLPEFEQISQLINQSRQFVPVTHNSEIVTMSSGIKNKRRVLSDNDFRIFVITPFLFLDIFEHLTSYFFDKIKYANRFFYLFNSNAPRAPPFDSIFRHYA